MGVAGVVAIVTACYICFLIGVWAGAPYGRQKERIDRIQKGKPFYPRRNF